MLVASAPLGLLPEMTSRWQSTRRPLLIGFATWSTMPAARLKHKGGAGGQVDRSPAAPVSAILVARSIEIRVNGPSRDYTAAGPYQHLPEFANVSHEGLFWARLLLLTIKYDPRFSALSSIYQQRRTPRQLLGAPHRKCMAGWPGRPTAVTRSTSRQRPATAGEKIHLVAGAPWSRHRQDHDRPAAAAAGRPAMAISCAALRPPRSA